MKLGQAAVSLFSFAKLVDAEGGVRGRELGTGHGHLFSNDHWRETLTHADYQGQCSGAVCGLWGDPHLLTCDGLGFDCNAVGVFNLMSNFLYNIQTHYINVGTVEMESVEGRWGGLGRATYTSDVAIQNAETKDDDHPEPVLQFSFPEFIPDDGLPLSEHNCFTGFVYNEYLQNVPHVVHNVESIADCRDQCLNTDGCFQFSWGYGSKDCKLADENAVVVDVPSDYERVVSGQVDRCGTGYEGRGGVFPEEAKMYMNDYKYRPGSDKGHKNARSCPVLFYKDGALQDIHDAADESTFFVSESGNTTASFVGRNKIMIVTQTKEGNKAEVMLETAGEGPGQLFGCHWNIFICLPVEEQQKFLDTSTGLMGSPDGNTDNDWTTVDGDIITLPAHRNTKKLGTKGQEAFTYCTENWCVKHEDNLITPPEGATFDDIKCQGEDYVPITDDSCNVGADAVRDHCSMYNVSTEPLFVATCEVECCLDPDCDIDDIFETLSGRVEDEVYDHHQEDPQCKSEHEYNGLGDHLCPGVDADRIIEIEHQSSDQMGPIIYDIKFGTPHDQGHGRTVSFRVDPPADIAKAYVRYSKKVGEFANDPACDKFVATPGCMEGSNNEVTVGCIEYPGVAPFAFFDVFFASGDISPDGTEIEKCCHPDHDGYDPNTGSDKNGVVKYSYKIQCGCPDTA